MERRIGEIFKYKNHILKVVNNNIQTCSNCFFNENNSVLCDRDTKITGICSSFWRSDKNKIIFKEVKKW